MGDRGGTERVIWPGTCNLGTSGLTERFSGAHCELRRWPTLFGIVPS
jgi:hypothetical protein